MVTKSYHTNRKLKLIGLLSQGKEIHLRELSRLLKTGMPNIIRYVNILKKEGVIRIEREANLVKVKLKAGAKTLAYLKQVNVEKFLNMPEKIQLAINDFLNELQIKPLISLIFGSYAKNSYSEISDIDLLLIYQKVEKEKDIENSAKRISMRTNTKISPIYIDYKNFEKNFLNKKHDFSKEIRENVIIINGAEYYYSLLWRFLE